VCEASSYGADSEIETLTSSNSPTNRDTDMRELAHEQVIAVMLRLPDMGLIVEQACGALQVCATVRLFCSVVGLFLH
jgi:hypothetical protein